MVELCEYEALRVRPNARLLMFQNWRDLTFLHFSCDPSEVQPLIPPELTVDTHDGKAWVGLVPFRMCGVRAPGLPALPWLSAFPETNVRTYVHCQSAKPGVWFFSLDAARWLACKAARMGMGLPYFHAQMSTRSEEGEQVYGSDRGGIRCDVRVRPGASFLASPGSLDFFLVERYLLYSRFRGGLIRGQVHHVPYPLRRAELLSCEEGMISAAGLRCRPWEHVCYSEGVDVEIFRPEWVPI